MMTCFYMKYTTVQKFGVSTILQLGKKNDQKWQWGDV